jgi:hypothetical protein
MMAITRAIFLFIMAITRAINFKSKPIPTVGTILMPITFTVFTCKFYNAIKSRCQPFTFPPSSSSNILPISLLKLSPNLPCFLSRVYISVSRDTVVLLVMILCNLFANGLNGLSNILMYLQIGLSNILIYLQIEVLACQK